MMKRSAGVAIIAASVLLACPVLANPLPAAAPHGVLRIRVLGLPSSDGLLRLGLYRSKRAYTTRKGSFRKAVLPVTGQTCEWVLEDVPYGEYALMFYHDRNANHKLDRNRLGIPIEPFGFSNNARPRLGPPGYDRVRFKVDADLITIELRAQFT